MNDQLDVALTSAQVSRLLQKSPNWFSSARVRKRLYGQGFPRPRVAGRWSRAAVLRWLAGEPSTQAEPGRGTPSAGGNDQNWADIIARRGAALDEGIDPNKAVLNK